MSKQDNSEMAITIRSIIDHNCPPSVTLAQSRSILKTLFHVKELASLPNSFDESLITTTVNSSNFGAITHRNVCGSDLVKGHYLHADGKFRFWHLQTRGKIRPKF